MEFKDILRELRIEKGLTQTQLAKEINFSLSTITKWECGRLTPCADALVALSKYFKVPTDYLLGLID